MAGSCIMIVHLTCNNNAEVWTMQARTAEASSMSTYKVIVDDQEIEFGHPELTGGVIIDRVGAQSQGLVEIMDDGSQRQVKREDKFNLSDEHRFRKPPKFKRG